ncbi:MAG: tripartite tricarboxylate transporter substrate binding protein [Pseudomonadota bacterium]
MMSSRSILACIAMVAAAAAAFVSVSASAQSFPNRPIRIVVPYPPGGSNDIMGRLVAQKFSEAFGVQVVLDNRGGGNGVIGTEIILRAPPDGHSMLITSTNSHLITSLISKTVFHPIDDFTPLGTIDAADNLMVIHPGLPANSLQQFIALAKAKPGQINYATSTTSGLVTTAMFAQRVGIKIQHVPYKGAGPALNDLLGGHVQMFFSTPSSMVAHVHSGKLRAIGITSDQRLPALPDVATFAEQGITDFVAKSLRGMLAPKGTPKPIIDRWSAELQKILKMPDIVEKMAAQGMRPFYMTPEAYQALMRSEFLKYAQVIKAVEIKGER